MNPIQTAYKYKLSVRLDGPASIEATLHRTTQAVHALEYQSPTHFLGAMETASVNKAPRAWDAGSRSQSLRDTTAHPMPTVAPISFVCMDSDGHGSPCRQVVSSCRSRASPLSHLRLNTLLANIERTHRCATYCHALPAQSRPVRFQYTAAFRSPDGYEAKQGKLLRNVKQYAKRSCPKTAPTFTSALRSQALAPSK